MSLTLVTGAGGYVGVALLTELAQDGVPVVGLSRQREPGPDVVRGDFTNPEDLRALDDLEIGRVCHLAAVTGGCSEEDGLRVNVLGTRRLMRYLIDRGCRKFVLASSIAAVGLADSDFTPQAVPIPDEHPCLARDAYGLSKYLMEEMSRYFGRAHEDSRDHRFAPVQHIPEPRATTQGFFGRPPGNLRSCQHHQDGFG